MTRRARLLKRDARRQIDDKCFRRQRNIEGEIGDLDPSELLTLRAGDNLSHDTVLKVQLDVVSICRTWQVSVELVAGPRDELLELQTLPHHRAALAYFESLHQELGLEQPFIRELARRGLSRRIL
jgi:hypothetical protein